MCRVIVCVDGDRGLEIPSRVAPAVTPSPFCGTLCHARRGDPDGGRFCSSAPQDADHAPIGAPASRWAGNNQRLNVRRLDFDLLKAILTNCVRHRPENQNREGHPHFRQHLEGRISLIESIHPEKGRRLRAIFEKIEWE